MATTSGAAVPICSVVEEAKIAYVTDVEGHWGYFCNWVDHSNGVRFEIPGDKRQTRGTPEQLELHLEDGWHFVFGGDSCDKGPGSLRFLETMVRVKDKYPDRVHLLMGNRDINKLRWTAELDEAELHQDRIRKVPAAYWVAAKFRQTYWDFLTELAAKEEQGDVTDDQVLARNSKTNKLMYMLAKDMGSVGEFDFRRQELAHIKGQEVSEVTDDEVVKSYEDSLRPEGWMSGYLQRAQLGVRIGDVLIVHGQIICQFPPGQVRNADPDGVAWAIGSVPGVDQRIDDIGKWLEALNAWAHGQVEEWMECPTWRTPPMEPTYQDWAGRGGAELMAYGTPGSLEPTVVYGRWLTPGNMPQAFPAELQSYLKQQGIRYVLVGHTPHGNSPTVVPNGPVTLVMGDTSFSHMSSGMHYAGDNRGCAVCDISFEDGLCRIKGCTEQKRPVEFHIAPEDEENDKCDAYVGKMQAASEERFFVKALLRELGTPEDSYLMAHVEGFKYKTVEVKPSEIHNVLQGEAVKSNSPPTWNGESSFEAGGPISSEHFLNLSFGKLDRDGDGSVILSELMAAISDDEFVRQAMIDVFPGANLDTIFEELDKDKDQRISYEEFSSFAHNLRTNSRPSTRSNPISRNCPACQIF